MKKLHNFNSLNEFFQYTKRPENMIFQGQSLSSQQDERGGRCWSGTQTYQEAIDLFRFGWEAKAKDLEKALEHMPITKTATKNEYSVAGYQVSVPRYLQGVPTNMINSKRIQKKAKIVTLVKDISYHAGYSAKQIEDYSLKALQQVRQMEADGYAVNLYIILGVVEGKDEIAVKIKIKSANERLALSKIAFPLAHPSMLRRLLFKYIEVSEYVTEKSIVWGYGRPMDEKQLKGLLGKDEQFIPREL